MVYNPLFFCSHKHFLYEPGPVSSVLPVGNSTQGEGGAVEKERGFYCLMIRTVLVYIYFPGIVVIKAPFPECPHLDHNPTTFSRGQTGLLPRLPNLKRLEVQKFWL